MLAYTSAVGDCQTIYVESGLAPPLYCVALSLGKILQRTDLPSGAIHSSQEYSIHRPVRIGGRVRLLAWLERQREQRGLRILNFGVNVDDPDAQRILEIRTMLLIPSVQANTEAPPQNSSGSRSSERPGAAEDGALRLVQREISQEQLNQYSEVSGDHNPLHLDQDFAAGTQFGGIIAHGMLTLAYVNEMLTASLGEAWLCDGSLKARFKGAAYPGDRVETWGTLSKSEESADTYNVGLRNAGTGAELITGSAVVRKN